MKHDVNMHWRRFAIIYRDEPRTHPEDFYSGGVVFFNDAYMAWLSKLAGRHVEPAYYDRSR